MKKEITYPSPTLRSLNTAGTAYKPQGWSKSSNAPYYKKENAEWIRADIDEMILNQKNLVYRYDKYCGEGELSVNSFYQKINQSIRFLIDFMDEEGKYAAWYKSVRIHKEAGLGIALTWRNSGLADSEPKTPDFVENEVGREAAYLPVWKQKMDTWLESDSTEPFIQERIILTNEEVLILEGELAQLVGIEYSVNQVSIKIVKV